MKGKRHREEQIIAILRPGEAGLARAELYRQYGITEQTCCRWKAKYRERTVGMRRAETVRRSEPEAEACGGGADAG
jgi:putative transposase